jgi:hypothetical protein
MLNSFSSNFSWSHVNKTAATERDVIDLVRYTPFSIGYSFGNSVEDALIQVPRLLGFNNQPVFFSEESLSACWISRDHPNCWPMASPLAMALRRPEKGSCKEQKHSVDFVEWILARTEGLHQYFTPNLDQNQNMGEAEYCEGRSLLVTRPEPVTLSPSAKDTVYVLCVTGMLWTACQAIALAVARKQSELKSASVLFSLLAVIGVFLILLAPLLIVQDDPNMADCGSSVWFLIFGFSLCYGSLFAKLFRLYTIFTSRKLVVPRLSNRRLLIIVSVFVAIDFILLLIYSIHTPPEPFTFSTRVESNEDYVSGYREFTLRMCSFHVDSPVLILILIEKFLVAFAGAGMAFFIRQVDRRFSATSALGWSFYNMFLTAFIASILTIFFGPKDDLEFFLFTPIFCGLWIMLITLIALTLDSNVLLACREFSKPLRRFLGSKDSGPKDSKDPEGKQGSGETAAKSEPKRSHSSTIFVINREMFPSKYEFEGELLEKILEELNFQRTAVRRALANLPSAPSMVRSSTGLEMGQKNEGAQTRKCKLSESPRVSNTDTTLTISVDLPELRPSSKIEAVELPQPDSHV